ncbi:MAG: PSP1 domain-containing protein [Schwartzia sp. (in: firmicutes)]
MQTVVGVRFKQAGKIYYFGVGEVSLEAGDEVVVETARGVEFGRVVTGPRDVEDTAVVLPLKAVQRKATEEDRARVASNQAQEKEAFRIGEEKIAARALPMKLVGVEYTFDVNKIIFYFTADGRIDFRELVKDLAAVFRTRIELRQIGVRDEAKLLGGIGGCGRPLCCATFLGDFAPVSIRMAKEQNLSLNPTKISGVCGRLMCCLKYESDCYACPRAVPKKVLTPKVKSRVVSVEGEGRIVSLNQQRRQATILLDDGKTIVASWEDIVEKEEDTDLANIAALAAIAAIEAEAAGGDVPPPRYPKGGKNRRARDSRSEGKPHDGKTRRYRGEGAGKGRFPKGRDEDTAERRPRRPREDRRNTRREDHGSRRPSGE